MYPFRDSATIKRTPAVVACFAFAVSVSALVAPAASAGTPVTCGGQVPTITGTHDPDDLTGTSGPDVIAALAGHDVITGLGGDDVICGGRGVDQIDAGGGDDHVWGGADGVFERREGDWVEGGNGDDQLFGGNDPSETGGIDNHEDIVVYDNAAHGIVIDLDQPTVTGQGVDTIDGFYSVVGSAHADLITAAAETDLVRGLDGKDRITVDSDEGEVYGGEGADVLRRGFAVYGGGGDDRIRGAVRYATGGAGRDHMVGTQTSDNYRGGRGKDRLEGRSGRDFLDGHDGDDLVDGGTGNDWLRGGSDFDHLRAGRGDDLIEPDGQGGRKTTSDDLVVGANGSDTVSYANAYVARGVRVDLAVGIAHGAGRDVLRDVENARGTVFADVLVGTARSNTLTGDKGDDELTGHGGRDTFMPDDTEDDFAKPGDDTIRGGRSLDLVSYAFAGGSGGVTADLRTGTVSGRGEDALESIEQLEGTIASDTLRGDSRNNRLWGVGGDDKLRGRGGTDLAVGGNGADDCSAETTRTCEP